MSRIASVAGLVAVFALTLVSADPVDLVMGAVIGAALVALLGRRLDPAREPAPISFARRLAGFPLFVGAIVADIVTGTWDVALRVVHVRRVEQPGVVRIPIGDRTEHGVAVSALATTLSPGSVLIDVDWDRREMLLHVIDASDPEGVRAKLQRFYDRYQRQVFP